MMRKNTTLQKERASRVQCCVLHTMQWAVCGELQDTHIDAFLREHVVDISLLHDPHPFALCPSE